MTHFDSQRRAALLHLLSTASMLTVIPQALTDPEPWERLSSSIAKPSNLDATTSTFGGKLFEGRFTAYQSTSALPERIRLEITNHQGQAAILSNNLEEYTRCLEEGIAGTIALKSQKRFHEAMTIYQQEVPPKWRNEQRLKDIAERFQLVG
ncbi:MAG TPA: hypothetical protein VFB60_25540 [Ktedonobacteraceae bacterium]|nr:hypothetical protein [Ktedonobacteraceae bacterium]